MIRIKKEPEQEVAEIMAKLFSSKKKSLKEKLGIKSQEAEEIEKRLEDLARKSRTIKHTKGSLEEKYKATLGKKRKEVIEEYRKVVTKLKLLDTVEDFTVDKRKRIIITTAPVKVKKEEWKRTRTAGRYQIMVDFSAGNISNGIRAINIDKCHYTHDHPNLSSSHFCYGGELQADLNQEYSEHDLYEIVIDVLDLLHSTNDKHGYCSWEDWFSRARRRSVNYSFEQYESENATEGQAVVAYEEFSHQMMDSITIGGSTATEHYVALDPGGVASASFNEHQVEGELRARGLTREAAAHRTRHILRTTRGISPDSIEIRPNPDGSAVLFFDYNVTEHNRGWMSLTTTANETNETVSTVQPFTHRQVEQIFLHPNELEANQQPTQIEPRRGAYRAPEGLPAASMEDLRRAMERHAEESLGSSDLNQQAQLQAAETALYRAQMNYQRMSAPSPYDSMVSGAGLGSAIRPPEAAPVQTTGGMVGSAVRGLATAFGGGTNTSVGNEGNV